MGSNLEMLGAAIATCPCPLEVVPAKPAGHIQGLTNSIKAFIPLRLEGLGRKFSGRYASQGDFRCSISLCAPGSETPSVKLLRYSLALH